MNDVQMSVGRYIEKRRRELRITLKELADRLKALDAPRDSTTISNWENDRHPVPFELLDPLSIALEEPSPTKLYILAGVLNKVRGAHIIELLSDSSEEEIDRAERIVRALLENDYQK